MEANNFYLYLIEARKRVIFTLSIYGISTILGFVFYEQIIRFLIRALSLSNTNIVFTSPFQFINLAFACGFATGLVVTMPLIIVQVLSFLRPALKRNEFRMLTRYLPFSGLLFFAGFIFGAIIMKWQIDIFLGRAASLGIGNVLDISKLLSVVLLTSALMGIGFQFPVVLLVLLRLGVITRQQLTKKRLWVYLGSFIFTLFLPPDSILADIILSMPFILSFEATLLIDRFTRKTGKTKQL